MQRTNQSVPPFIFINNACQVSTVFGWIRRRCLFARNPLRETTRCGRRRVPQQKRPSPELDEKEGLIYSHHVVPGTRSSNALGKRRFRNFVYPVPKGKPAYLQSFVTGAAARKVSCTVSKLATLSSCFICLFILLFFIKFYSVGNNNFPKIITKRKSKNREREN